MGVELQSSSYRLRTIWTPEKDRYFIDLMLDQVGKENPRGDHLFSKRAWKYMTTMFNAKFNSEYETPVLKNRHKILRNLFRASRNLLGQKGFSWDESRQMVTADNRVWDEYIKAHPDARPYRMKTIPYYSDLVKIYGTVVSRQTDVQTSVDDMIESACVSEIGSEPLHDIMIDEDYQISVAKGMDDETYQFLSDIGSTIGPRTRTYWQPPMDRYFVDLILDQVKKGNHLDGLLRKQAWREMISSFNAKFGFSYAVDILKNRFKTLRRQHNFIKNLLELDGFGWDDARQMVIADDHVWQNYIKDHTNARQYMTRPVPYFKDLCMIFGELNDEVKYTISSHEDSQVKIFTINESTTPSVSSYDNFHKEMESSDPDFDTATTNPITKRQLATPSMTGSSKKPRSENEGVVDAIREMATAVSYLADKSKEDENANAVPVELVVAAIQALPDMDEELVLDACDLLEDQRKAKTFLALDVKLRKKWLMRKIRPSIVMT